MSGERLHIEFAIDEIELFNRRYMYNIEKTRIVNPRRHRGGPL
jgi:hypothetical protein